MRKTSLILLIIAAAISAGITAETTQEHLKASINSEEPQTLSAWDSGTADNDDGGSSDTDDSSTWDDGTADNDDGGEDSTADSGSQTEDSDTWDSDTADNDDGGSTDTDENTGWDNETANNNDTEWDSETADNNETTWDNQTADNNDGETSSTQDTSQTDETQNDGTDENQTETGNGGNEDDTDREDTSGSNEEDNTRTSSGGDSSGGVLHVILPDRITISITPDTIELGETVTVEGQLKSRENSNQQVQILMKNQIVGRTSTDSQGHYSKEIRPEDTGRHTVEVKSSQQSNKANIQVNPRPGNVRIASMRTSTNIGPGEKISVCINLSSPTSARVTLTHNGNLLGSKSGENQVCFDARLQEEENIFRATAEIPGSQDTHEITRTANPSMINLNQGTSVATGNFLTASSSLKAGIAALISIISAMLIWRPTALTSRLPI